MKKMWRMRVHPKYKGREVQVCEIFSTDAANFATIRIMSTDSTSTTQNTIDTDSAHTTSSPNSLPKTEAPLTTTSHSSGSTPANGQSDNSSINISSNGEATSAQSVSSGDDEDDGWNSDIEPVRPNHRRR
ncbi:hypothetical protein BDP27DRAFT_1343084 [Rhodocollybia butyracea]|uniref:Uncharacterized protein n=1 Tax=Rhodocollybia butyracea TaxID=206335 RepID=A0A9P5P8X2_9AGAR|nr:hypothetical protein BDP27DRAFT_1343084 [Rhodocollybia butyracea]